MAISEYRHKSKKVARAYRRGNRAPKLAVEVVVNRIDPWNKGKGAFQARACLARGRKIASKYGGGSVARCGRVVMGTSPTKAMKKALAALARSL